MFRRDASCNIHDAYNEMTRSSVMQELQNTHGTENFSTAADAPAS
jgi:hypothetical protein